VFADGLPIPAGDTRKTMRDVFNLYIKGRRIKKIQSAA
jgi:hypothetical protein